MTEITTAQAPPNGRNKVPFIPCMLQTRDEIKMDLINEGAFQQHCELFRLIPGDVCYIDVRDDMQLTRGKVPVDKRPSAEQRAKESFRSIVDSIRFYYNIKQQ